MTDPKLDLSSMDERPRRANASELCGRQWELASLRDARRRVANTGTCEIVLIAGEPGAGKTALAEQALGHDDGAWLQGCSACRPPADASLPDVVVTAVNEALHSILALPEQRQRWWREHIAGRLGESRMEACHLFDALRPFVSQSLTTAPPSRPHHARARRRYLLEQLITTLVASGHPLILFLDDLQWISPAETDDLRALLRPPELQRVMLIGAYRTNEVPQGHPLHDILTTVKQQTRVQTAVLELRNLDKADTCRLVTELLDGMAVDTHDMSELVYERTHGNPLFVHQFAAALRMQTVQDSSALSAAALLDMAGLGIADSVAAFIVERLGELPAAVRQLLFVMACLGQECDRRDLDVLGPLLGDGCGLDEGLRAAASSTLVADDGHRVRFLHDRIREAAYVSRTPEERELMHAAIAKLLMSCITDDTDDARLVAAAGHITRGAQRLRGVERERAAEVLLRAAAKARDTGLFAEALSYYDVGLSLCPTPRMPSGAALELTLGVAECRYLTGRLDEAEPLFDSLLKADPGEVVRLRIALLRTRYLSMQHRPAEALTAAGEAFSRLGIDYRADATVMPGLVMEELQRTETALARIGGVRALGTIAPIEDEALLWAVRAASETLAALFLGRPLLFSLTTARLMRAITESGSFEQAWHLLSMYGVVKYGATGDAVEAARLCQTADRFCEKGGDSFLLGRAYLVHGAFVMHLYSHVDEGATMLRKALDLTSAAGDLLCAGLSCIALAAARLYSGCPLEPLADELLAVEQHVRRTGNRYFLAVSRVRRRLVDALRGVTETIEALADTPAEEQALIRQLESAEGGAGELHVHFYREVLMVYLGRYGEAFSASECAERRCSATGSNIATPMHRFYRLLAIAGSARESNQSDKNDLLALAERELGAFARWRTACPANFGSHYLVAAAFVTWARGEPEAALQLLAEAVDEAREHGFIQVRALAHWYMGRIWHELRRQAMGDMHLQQARECFERWGAMALVTRSGPLSQAPERFTPPAAPGAPSTNTALLDSRDRELIGSSARTICEAVDAGGLGARLLDAVASHVPASDGAMVLARGDSLELVAVLDGKGAAARIRPLDTSRRVAVSVVREVYLTGVPVRIDALSAHHPYRSDRYFANARAGSLLCLPIRHGTATLGVLFLLGGRSGAFTAHRTALVTGLIALVSVAFRNAVLIEELQETNRRLSEQNQERRSAEKRLRAAENALSREQRRLERKNTALQELLREVKAQRRTTREELIAGLEQSLYTNLAAGTVERDGGTASGDGQLGAVRASLRTLAPEYVVDLNDRRLRLTPREHEIATMVRAGLCNKDIARILSLTPRTVGTHRNNIRHKLGLSRKGTNLTSYLRAQR
ncbi:MAG: AAA family ATPase [Chitinivibrionales bacterium]|nr:AAA family ATPase [Chitinivibrionales bacterium]